MFIKLKLMQMGGDWGSSAMAHLLIICLFAIAASGLSSVDERGPRKLFGGYRITPKYCRASKTLPRSDPRSNGPTICMFNHECAQRQGEVVGACMDGFLFGACCQVPEVIESSLIQQNTPQIPSNLAAAYETYGSQQTSQESRPKRPSRPPSQGQRRPTTTTNRPSSNPYYDSDNEVDSDLGEGSVYISNENTIVEDTKNNQFYVQDESVIVSSPATNHFDQSSFFTQPTQPPQGVSYSSELPSLFNTPDPFGTTYGDDAVIVQKTPGPNVLSDDGLPQIFDHPSLDEQFNTQFTHSDITHPSADSVLIEDDLEFSDGYGPSTVYVPAPTKSTPPGTTTTTKKPPPRKPVFRPKPTAATAPTATTSEKGDEKYVLVPTINKDKPIKKPTMTSNDIESIESIMLMLNDTKHGPAYDTESSTKSPAQVTYGVASSYVTQRPALSTNSIDYDKYGSSDFYVTTDSPLMAGVVTTHRPPAATRVPSFSSQPTGYGSISLDKNAGYLPSTTRRPPFVEDYGTSTHRPTTNYLTPSSSTFSTSTTTTTTTTRKPTTTKQRPRPVRPSGANDNEIIITPTRRPITRVPIKTSKPSGTISYVTGPTQKLPSTSYVTGPSTPRPTATTSYGSSPSHTAANKIDLDGYGTTPSVFLSSYGQPSEYPSSTTQKIGVEHVVQSKPIEQEPSYVQISGTQRPSPTVIITPKPTVKIMMTSSSWTQRPPTTTQYTTPMNSVNSVNSVNPKLPSTSYIYSPVVTQRPPGFMSTTQEYINLPPVISNDFDDPGYYGTTITDRPPSYDQFITDSLFTAAPGDDRPSFPGYYGPTPSYPAFNVPTASMYPDNIEEEIYTSPNDFVNFPPVRNPNLNMSATSSSVTNDFDISTPAFVEDDVLKDKMNTLVSKIVESLQGNFDELADIIEERNISHSNAQNDPGAQVTTLRPQTTRRPATTTKRVTPSRQTVTARPPPRTTTRRPGSGGAGGAGGVGGSPGAPGSPGAGGAGGVGGAGGGATRPTPVRPASASRPTPSRPTPTRKATTATTKRTPATRRPTTPTTKRPAQTKTSTTRRPTTKPTRKVQTTTVQQDEIIDEENQEENASEEETTSGGEPEEAANSSENERRFRCGIRPHVKSGRIVGGKGATFGEWPWQVLVRESTWLGLFTKNKCGGVLITNKYVITAAHCQPGFLASLVAVFGEFDISGDLEAKRSVTKNVKRVIVHRQYDAATFENDLALLELESAIHYDTHIVPICMPPDVIDFTGRMATVTGWGRLKYGGGVPSVLQEVKVPIIENSVCQEMFHTAGHNKKILPSFLCAGYANGQKDSCEGDSGGPLVLQREDGRWELAGTVSHGIKCAAPYLPGVYMRTTFYKPWLRSITGIK